MQNVDEFLERCNRLMMGQDPAGILRKAHETISDPTRWTQGSLARDSDGHRVRSHDPSARAWDVEGAVAMACNPYGILPPFFMKLLDEVAAEYGAISIGDLNDNFRHDVVLEALQRAIARCQTKG